MTGRRSPAFSEVIGAVAAVSRDILRRSELQFTLNEVKGSDTTSRGSHRWKGGASSSAENKPRAKRVTFLP